MNQIIWFLTYHVGFDKHWNHLGPSDVVINPHTHVTQKVADEVIFDISKVKESISNLTDPPQIFNAHVLENTNYSLSSFHFSVGFYIKICFEFDGFIAYPNEWDWREKKRCPFTLTNL